MILSLKDVFFVVIDADILIKFLGENVMVMEEIREYNKQLIAKYPWLLPRNRWTGEVIDDYDYSYTELDDMPDGWRAAFGEQMCEEIQQALNVMEPDVANTFRIMQIKEKYGFLHFYTNWLTDQIREIIYKYEEISKYTCIRCGAPATQITTGWICPFCDKCAEVYHGNTIDINEFYKE